MSISVLIADDHIVLLAGLRALLSAEPDLQVIGQASNGTEALRLANQLQPDVVLGDINMPGASGIEVAQQLRGQLPRTRVLILTMYEDANLIEQAMRAGARGYIAKRAVESGLIDGVRAVARGDIYVQSGLRETQLEGATSAPPPGNAGRHERVEPAGEATAGVDGHGRHQPRGCGCAGAGPYRAGEPAHQPGQPARPAQPRRAGPLRA